MWHQQGFKVKFFYLVNSFHRNNNTSGCKHFWPECLVVANSPSFFLNDTVNETLYIVCSVCFQCGQSCLMKLCLEKLLLGYAVLFSGLRQCYKCVYYDFIFNFFFAAKDLILFSYVVQLEALFISSFPFIQRIC